MPPQDRFDRLEAAPLPDNVKEAISRLSRFQALEIGASASPASAQPNAAKPVSVEPAPASSSADPSHAVQKVPCVHCGQLNEAGRETCWACYRFVRVKAPPPQTLRDPNEITLVLDGVTYTSGQPDLPDDIAELMRRIKKNGYSQQLLADWRQWRVTRHTQPPPTRDFEPSPENTAGSDDSLGIKVFRGQRVSVIRLDGKVYTSDDPSLSAELKALFQYIDAHGVTPALMEHLRQLGGVKLRPPTTAYPSDGDVAFWNSVQQSRQAAGGPSEDLAGKLARADAQRELDAAQRRYDEARRRAIGSAIGVAFFLLYIIVSLFLR